MRPIPLTTGHIPDAFALSSIADWNQPREDWRMLLGMPGACFGIEIEGKLVATATLICYGRALGLVGMVLTHPDYRRRGFARALVSHVMEHARTAGVNTLKLDATNEGLPLYESLGFRAEQQVERWKRASFDHTPADTTGPAAFPWKLDACGYDRRHLLERLSGIGEGTANAEAFALSRPGRLNRYLGPCVALNQTAARDVIEATLTRHPEDGWFWDLLAANRDAVALAQDLGFECVRRLTRMTWGPDIPSQDNRIYAIAGLELG